MNLEENIWQRGRIGKCTSLENWRPVGHVGSRPTAVAYHLELAGNAINIPIALLISFAIRNK